MSRKPLEEALDKCRHRLDLRLLFAAMMGAIMFVAGPTTGANSGDASGPHPPGLTAVIEHPGGTIELIGLERAGAWGPLLARGAAEAEKELPLRIGLALPSRVRVVFCPDASTFAGVARVPRGSLLLGAARPEQGIAALNGPLLGPSPEVNAVRTLRHELAHLAMGTVAERAGPIPRWFDEGVASWFAGGFAELGPLDLAPADAGRGLSLSRLAQGFPEDPDGLRIAYVKSQLVVELLEREHGAGTVAAIGKAMRNGVPFADALRGVTGLDDEALEAEFRRSTAPYGLLIAVFRRSLSPFLIMSGLVIVGFVLRRLRARRRLRQWEREETRAMGLGEKRAEEEQKEPESVREGEETGSGDPPGKGG